jgi:solute carrier family 25 citrate transporter 1
MGLYKGLGAVLGGIIPKMAIRFTSYETYKGWMADPVTGNVTSKATFLGKYTSIAAASAIVSLH